MQRKKNIRLLITLGVLTAVAILLALTKPSKDRLDVEKEIFAVEDPRNIDRVMLTRDSSVDTISFQNGTWMLNSSYKADPQRVSVLFAILKQAQVRRKAAASQEDSIQAWMDRTSTRTAFYEGNELVKHYDVAGDPNRGITYFREDSGEPVYLMGIPGYKSYLAGIYEVDANGWRYPRVFDFNWSNLKDVTVSYPRMEAQGFSVSFRDGFFRLDQVSETDTSRMTDFLDDLSLLYVNDYLFQAEESAYDSLKDKTEAQITVRDVGDNRYHMDVLGTLPGKSEILVRIDSAEYALADYNSIRKLLRPRSFFKEKAAAQ